MSYTLLDLTVRKARKAHSCIWCGEIIPAAETYHDERSVYEGSIQRLRWHPECHAASQKWFREMGEESFQPGENKRPERREGHPPPPEGPA